MTNPQGGVNLGSAYGDIVINDNIDQALGRAMGAFDNALSAIGGRMERLGSQMSAVGQRLTVVTAPLALFGVQGVRVAAQYEDALKEIQVRAGLTAEELAEVAAKTEQIGIESQFGPAQAADAFLQLLSSGSSVAEAMQQIDAVIQGASASGQELGYTADALTDVMAAFGLEASQSADVMQTLVDATSSSSATFTDLVAGFANVGPAALNAGLSVEETAAALAVFAENGIKGAEGGTQLKTVLTQLQSDRARKELDRLGVSLEDMDGNIRPLNDVIKDLNVSMADMTQAERNQAIMELVGSYGQLGLSALLASDGIGDMTDTMSEQAALETIAAARMDTFSGSIKFLQGSVELLQIRALKPLMDDALRPMILMIADVVNKISDWIVANPQLSKQIIRVLAIITAAGPVLIALGTAVSFIGTAVSGLGLLLGVLLSPIFLVVGAIGVLIAKFVDFGALFHQLNIIAGNFQLNGFREGLRRLFTTFEDGSSYVSGLLEALGFSEEVAQRVADAINQGIVPALVNFGRRVKTAFDRLEKAAGPVLEEIGEFIANNLGGLEAFVGNVIKVGATLLSLTNPIGQIRLVLQAFNIDIIAIFEELLAGVGRFFESLNEGSSGADALRAAFGDTEFINGFIEGFEAVVGFVQNDLLPTLGRIYDWFVEEALPRVVEFVEGTVIPIVQGFFEGLGNVWAVVGPALENIARWFIDDALPAIVRLIRDSIIPAIQTFVGTLVNIWETVRPHLENLARWFLEEAIPAVLNFITTTVIPGIETLIYWLQQIWEAVGPVIEGLVDWFLNTGLPVIQNAIENVIVPVIEFFIGILQDIWEAVSPFLQSLLDWFEKNGWPIIEGILNAATGIIQGFIDILAGIWAAVSPALNSLKDLFVGTIGWVIDNVLTPALNAINDILYGLGLVQAQSGTLMRDDEVADRFGDRASGVVSRAVGTNYLPMDMLVQAHKGEAIIPAALNPYNPDAARASDNQSSASGGGGQMFEFAAGSVVIYASGYDEGRAAADGFSERLEEIMRGRDVQ